jgi:hypothetical protein
MKNDSRRLFVRGEQATFRVAFYEDVAASIPAVPLDISVYPSYSIYDTTGVVVQSGVGQPEAQAGQYKAMWLIPADAPLSSDVSRWSIEWTLVDQDQRQYNFTQEFDVNDVVISASETREQKYITLQNEATRVSLRLGKEVLDVGLSVYANGNLSTPIVQDVTTGGGGVQIVKDGDSIVYYYDIAAYAFNPTGGTGSGVQFYSVIWKYRYNVVDPYTFVYQSLSTIPPAVLEEITSVRMLIDKFQKRLGTVQAYEDSDILEYLARGNELVNAVYPTTYFGFGFLPGNLLVFHVLYAAMYGLNAQQLLENDLAFDFSGQSVTLNMDRTGVIGEVIGRWEEFIRNNLPPAKMSLVRRTQAVGVVAGRAYRYNALNNFTFKVASYRSSGSMGLLGALTRLGLLF